MKNKLNLYAGVTIIDQNLPTHTGELFQICWNAERLNSGGISLEQATAYIIPAYRLAGNFAIKLLVLHQ